MSESANSGADLFARQPGTGVSLPPTRRGRRDFLTPIVVAVAVILAGGVLLRVAANVMYPFALEDTETAVLGASWRAADGSSFYGLALEPPLVVTVYNPLLICAAGLVMRVFGPTPAGPRLLVAAFYLGSAVVVYLLAGKETKSRSAALVAAGFFLAERHLFARAGHAVVDYPALFFSLLGLYFWRGSQRARLAGTVAFALAFFTRQTSLIACAAALAWLFLRGQRSQALRAAAAFVALVAAGLAICWLLFGKAYFINTFYYVQGSGYLPSKAVEHVLRAMALYVVAFVGWLLLALRDIRSRQVSLPVLYTLLALVSAFTVGMSGAGYGYFFDLAAALSVVVGILWAAVAARVRAGGLSAALAAAVALQVLLAAVGVYPEMRRAVALPQLASLADRGARALLRDKAIRAAYEDNDGFILCREAAMETGARAKSVGSDMYKISQLIRTGRLPADTLTRLVRQRRLSLVIVPHRDAGWVLFPDDLLSEIRLGYSLDYTLHGLDFYRPSVESPALADPGPNEEA